MAESQRRDDAHTPHTTARLFAPGYRSMVATDSWFALRFVLGGGKACSL
jgi:hypothetical protein